MSLCKASSPKLMVCTATGLGPSPPQGYSLFWSFQDSPIPTYRLPQLDSPSAFPPPQPVHLAQVSFVIPAFNTNFTLDLELNQ